jgi:hypothetical protein
MQQARPCNPTLRAIKMTTNPWQLDRLYMARGLLAPKGSGTDLLQTAPPLI